MTEQADTTHPLLSAEHEELLADPEVFERLSRYQHQEEQLVVGFVPGMMPGKWFGRWHERFGQIRPLVEMPLSEKNGLAALDEFATSTTGRSAHDCSSSG